MKNIPLIPVLFALLLLSNMAAASGDTLSGTHRHIVLEAGTPVSFTVQNLLNSRQIHTNGIVPLEVHISLKVNGVEVAGIRDYGEAIVKRVRKAGKWGRPGSIEIEAIGLRAVDGQMIPLHGAPYSVKGNSRAAVALGVSVATTGLGMAMMDRQSRPAALGFSLTGLFVKGQEAIIEKDVILRGYVAQRAIVKLP